MKKFLYEKALLSKPYPELVEWATERLLDADVFSKSELLKGTGYEAVARSIRWDYVRRMIEATHHTKLIPLCALYFQRHSYKDEIMNPRRYMALGGKGKDTVGWANATAKNGHFVKNRYDMDCSVANGCVASAKNTLKIGLPAGVAQLHGDVYGVADRQGCRLAVQEGFAHLAPVSAAGRRSTP
jgi:hypothetical protein